MCDYLEQQASLHHKLKELISDLPFPLSAAIIMHLQQKEHTSLEK